MPNHVMNIVRTSRRALDIILNEKCEVDFRKILPFPGEELPNANDIYVDAEIAVNIWTNSPLSTDRLIASLEQESRNRFNVHKMSCSSYDQAIAMRRNFLNHGFKHSMEWARIKWGTKWNAYDQVVQLDEVSGLVRFNTAWSTPEPIFMEWSRLCPEDEIKVTFADEDIGSNCGELVYLGGVCTKRHVAPRWKDMSEEEWRRWRAFGYEVHGYSADDIANALSEDEASDD